MKKMLSLASILFFFSASAQMTQDDVNLVQAMYGKSKRDLMEAYMTFSDTGKANKFWKMYDSYEAERKKLGQQYLGIIQDYAKNYSTLNDAKADQLVARMS